VQGAERRDHERDREHLGGLGAQSRDGRAARNARGVRKRRGVRRKNVTHRQSAKVGNIREQIDGDDDADADHQRPRETSLRIPDFTPDHRRLRPAVISRQSGK